MRRFRPHNNAGLSTFRREIAGEYLHVLWDCRNARHFSPADSSCDCELWLPEKTCTCCYTKQAVNDCHRVYGSVIILKHALQFKEREMLRCSCRKTNFSWTTCFSEVNTILFPTYWPYMAPTTRAFRSHRSTRLVLNWPRFGGHSKIGIPEIIAINIWNFQIFESFVRILIWTWAWS